MSRQPASRTWSEIPPIRRRTRSIFCRRRRSRALLAVCGLAVIQGGCTRESAVPAPAAVDGKVGETLDGYLSALVPFGYWGAALVAVGDHIVLNQGYGWADEANRLPNTVTTTFGIQSVSKQFTAAAVLKLQEAGDLAVGDSLGAFFPSIPSDKRGITLHQLLTHTSGLIPGTETTIEDRSRRGVLATVFEAPLEFPPGSDFLYSNLGYSVLAAVVESVSGFPFERYLREQLFRPAGLEWTGYRLPEWPENTIAHWYAEGQDHGSPRERPYPDWNQMGGGGLLSTTGDLFRWHQALLGDEILSTASKRALYTAERGDYAYGWRVGGSEHGHVVQHNGGHSDGMASEFRRYLDADVTLILFCNRDGETMLFGERLADHVAALALGEVVDPPPRVREARSGELEDFVGKFRLAGGDTLRMELQDGVLTLRAFDQSAVQALLGKDDASRYAELNRRARDALRDLARGDSAGFTSILAEPGPSNRLATHLRRRLESGVVDFGPFADFTVLATTPDWVSGLGPAMTFVRAGFRGGSVIFRLHWGEEGVVALGGSGIPEPIRIRYLPAAGGGLAGYHLATATPSHLRMERAAGKQALILPGEIRAERVP